MTLETALLVAASEAEETLAGWRRGERYDGSWMKHDAYPLLGRA